MRKRLMVTGGSGFLGRQLVAKAEAAGYDVLAPRSRECDLHDWSSLDSYLSRVGADGPIQCIIHSAAYYGGIGINQTEPATIFFRNSQMALNVFEAAREHDVRKVLPIGSACSYPGYLTGDLQEDKFWDGCLHESVEAYGFSKKIQQVGQRAYFKQHGIESNHLVLTNLYGPHDVFTEYRSHVASALIKKFSDASLAKAGSVTLWGDGSPIREFLYVEDAAEAIIRAIDLEHDIEPINIGTGIGTTIKELADLTAEFVGFPGEIVWDTDKPNGAARKVLDVTRMKEKLQWEPKCDFRTGLKSTVDWYVANKQEADARE